MNSEFLLLAEFQKSRISLKELADFMGVTFETAQNQRALGRLPIPTYKEGARVYADIRDIAAYLDTMREQAIDTLSAAARDVLAERRRQVEAEGWTPEHDDKHVPGSLTSAAGCYAMYTLAYPAGDPPPAWPWDATWWKPSNNRRNLEKAGALILAEIERLDRAAHAGMVDGND